MGKPPGADRPQESDKDEKCVPTNSAVSLAHMSGKCSGDPCSVEYRQERKGWVVSLPLNLYGIQGADCCDAFKDFFNSTDDKKGKAAGRFFVQCYRPKFCVSTTGYSLDPSLAFFGIAHATQVLSTPGLQFL